MFISFTFAHNNINHLFSQLYYMQINILFTFCHCIRLTFPLIVTCSFYCLIINIIFITLCQICSRHQNCIVYHICHLRKSHMQRIENHRVGIQYCLRTKTDIRTCYILFSIFLILISSAKTNQRIFHHHNRINFMINKDAV